MKPDRRPPASIEPEQFFTTWLPEEVDRLGSAAGIPDMLARVELSGEGGGAWDLHTSGGKLQVTPAQPGAAPLVTLSLSVQDWRAIVVGEPGPVDLAPPASSPLDLLFVDQSSRQLLETISGTFRFEVRDYNGRTWTLTAIFGSEPRKDPPDAVIATDAETYSAILDRKLSPPEAYFTGKITIEGDAGLGMQVGMALLPKL